jgi:anthranilate/para-aminobenzoate synthase component II
MVVIKEVNDDDFNNETMFDVTRFTSFLQKDNSFLTPWSWKPNTSMNDINSTKEKQYLTFHPESYFSYQVIFYSLLFVILKSLSVILIFLFLLNQ